MSGPRFVGSCLGRVGFLFLWVRDFFEGGDWTESGRWSGGRGWWYLLCACGVCDVL